MLNGLDSILHINLPELDGGVADEFTCDLSPMTLEFLCDLTLAALCCPKFPPPSGVEPLAFEALPDTDARLGGKGGRFPAIPPGAGGES